MAIREDFQPVAFFVGILFIDRNILSEALERMSAELGDLPMKSEPIPFEYTHYYEKEMGKPIFRMWAGSPEPRDPSMLASWKLITDKIERETSRENRRTINLDPGFVGLAKVVLASLKDHPQRMPLSDGVYAEIELIFQNGIWQDVPWTYRDYKDKPAKDFLFSLRKKLHEKIKRQTH